MIRTLAMTAALTATLGAGALAAPLSPAPKLPNLSAPLNLKPTGPIELRYAQARPPLPRGVAQTSVERKEGGVTGSAGVLCGIQPSADDSGVGTARGYDNEGRFVGAKLAFSF